MILCASNKNLVVEDDNSDKCNDMLTSFSGNDDGYDDSEFSYTNSSSIDDNWALWEQSEDDDSSNLTESFSGGHSRRLKEWQSSSDSSFVSNSRRHSTTVSFTPSSASSQLPLPTSTCQQQSINRDLFYSTPSASQLSLPPATRQQQSADRGFGNTPLYDPFATTSAKKDAYITWTSEEIEEAQKAYDVVVQKLQPERQRFLVSEVLKQIRADPTAVGIFHPSHIQSSIKFRHVIRKYVIKEE